MKLAQSIMALQRKMQAYGIEPRVLTMRAEDVERLTQELEGIRLYQSADQMPGRLLAFNDMNIVVSQDLPPGCVYLGAEA